MPDRLGVLILGAIRHAADYATLIAAHPQLRLVGVAELPSAPAWQHARAHELAAAHGVPAEAAPDALTRRDVDLVVVTTEPTRHAAAGIAALEAGRHVLVDKPVATTSTDAIALADVARRTDVVSAYFHTLFSPALERLRAHVATGSTGTPETLQLVWTAANAIEDEGGEQIIDPVYSGGGELRNFLGYPIDTAVWTTGLPVQRVFALGTNVTSEPHQRHSVESLATVALEHTSGLVTAISVGRAPAVGGSVFAATLVGSHGLVHVDESRPAVDVRTRIGETSAGDDERFEALMRGLLDDIVGAIEHGQPLRRTLVDGCDTARVIDAACRSAASGQPLEITPR